MEFRAVLTGTQHEMDKLFDTHNVRLFELVSSFRERCTFKVLIRANEGFDGTGIKTIANMHLALTQYHAQKGRV